MPRTKLVCTECKKEKVNTTRKFKDLFIGEFFKYQSNPDIWRKSDEEYAVIISTGVRRKIPPFWDVTTGSLEFVEDPPPVTKMKKIENQIQEIIDMMEDDNINLNLNHDNINIKLHEVISKSKNYRLVFELLTSDGSPFFDDINDLKDYIKDIIEDKINIKLEIIKLKKEINLLKSSNKRNE